MSQKNGKTPGPEIGLTEENAGIDFEQLRIKIPRYPKPVVLRVKILTAWEWDEAEWSVVNPKPPIKEKPNDAGEMEKYADVDDRDYRSKFGRVQLTRAARRFLKAVMAAPENLPNLRGLPMNEQLDFVMDKMDAAIFKAVTTWLAKRLEDTRGQIETLADTFPGAHDGGGEDVSAEWVESDDVAQPE